MHTLFPIRFLSRSASLWDRFRCKYIIGVLDPEFDNAKYLKLVSREISLLTAQPFEGFNLTHSTFGWNLKSFTGPSSVSILDNSVMDGCSELSSMIFDL
jgi:hypothetical protein